MSHIQPIHLTSYNEIDSFPWDLLSSKILYATNWWYQSMTKNQKKWMTSNKYNNWYFRNEENPCFPCFEYSKQLITIYCHKLYILHIFVPTFLLQAWLCFDKWWIWIEVKYVTSELPSCSCIMFFYFIRAMKISQEVTLNPQGKAGNCPASINL